MYLVHRLYFLEFLLGCVWLSSAKEAGNKVSTSAEVTDDAWEALPGKLDSFMETFLRCRRIPGLSLAVVSHDRKWTTGFGLADLEKESPATENTLFCIASLTKAFTSMALGILLRNSSYTWDSPIRDIIQDEVEFRDERMTRELTIRDLLLHQTGVSRYDVAWYSGALNREQLLKRIRCMSGVEMRTTAVYNNVMWALAGRVAEVLAGMDYETLVTDLLLGPLHMDQTTFLHWQRNQSAQSFATQYSVIEDAVHKTHPLLNRGAEAVSPAISICSTSNDMVKWIKVLLNDGRNEKGHQIVPVDVVKECFRPQVDSTPMYSPELQIDGNVFLSYTEYGLGWFVGRYRDYEAKSHYGSFPGYYSQITLIPSKKLGIYSSINGGRQLGPCAINSVLHSYIVDSLLQETVLMQNTSLACHYPHTSAMDQVDYTDEGFNYPTIPLWRDLSDYSGTYYSPSLGNITVYVNHTSKQLNMRYGYIHFILRPIQKEMEQFYASPDTFKWSMGSFSVKFKLSAQRKTIQVPFEQLDSGIFVWNSQGYVSMEECQPSIAGHTTGRVFEYLSIICVLIVKVNYE